MLGLESHVKIGQILVAGKGEILKTVLGSCVGIALIWKRQEKCALAHCLLPESDQSVRGYDARYVNLAVPKLIERLGVTDLSEIQAVIAGGGQMIDVERSMTKYVVGEANLAAAKKYLLKYRIKIIALEPGGPRATKMQIDAGTGIFEIERIVKAA